MKETLAAAKIMTVRMEADKKVRAKEAAAIVAAKARVNAREIKMIGRTLSTVSLASSNNSFSSNWNHYDKVEWD